MDRKMKKILYIFTLTLLFSSCLKNKTVIGRVYNPLTNKGVEGIRVVLLRPKHCLGIGCGTKQIDVTTTDANGNYALNHSDGNGHHIRFVNDNKNDFTALNSNESSLNGNTEYDYLIVSHGYLQKHRTNTNCFDSEDKLNITHYYHELKQFSDNSEYDSYGSSTYDGCFDKTYNNNHTVMGWRYYEGTVTKNNITTPFIDSVYVPEGGSVVWNIEW